MKSKNTILFDYKLLMMITTVLLLSLFNNKLYAQGTTIVGGSAAEIEDYPWQVALVRAGNYTAKSVQFCGGSIINEEWILTAAHCLDDFSNANEISIAYGMGSLEEDDNTISYVEVEAFYLHPNYDDQSQDNDIALIKLASPIPTGATAQIISYATSNTTDIEADGYSSYVTGWGNMSGEDGGSDFPDQLMAAEVPVVSNTRANRNNSYGGAITDGMLVAGFMDGGIDACQGDSGGPLAAQDADGKWVQIGVVSWGYGCARANYPGVYARVSYYQDWIEGYLGVPEGDTTDGSDDAEDSGGTDDNSGGYDPDNDCVAEELSNMTDGADLLVDLPENGSGYCAGNNSYQDLAVFERFDVGGARLLENVGFGVHIAKDGDAASNVTIQVLGDNNGQPDPNNVILQSLAPLANLQSGYINGFSFDGVEVPATFYVGIAFSYDAGDTLVLYTSDAGENNYAFTQASDGSFMPFFEETNWNRSRTILIRATVACLEGDTTADEDDTAADNGDGTDDDTITDNGDATGDDDDTSADNGNEGDDTTNEDDGVATFIIEEEGFSFNIYPNPADYFIAINATGEIYGAQVFIYNILGEMVMQVNPNQARYIDITNFNRGLYFVNITNGYESYTKQFIVE
jgi:V8-like Glu-specific endopeptidase